MLVSEDNFDIKKEVNMLSCGPELALLCDAMGMLYKFINQFKFIQYN